MPPTELTAQTRLETDLSARALDGDVEAFTELFAMHEQALQNVAYRVTGSREDAADIAQEAFLRVFARLDALAERPDVNLAAYLFRTARNLVYDHHGRSGRETLQDDLERSAGADDALEEDPERARLVDAQVEEVRAANARLPERHRLVLALRELEGMSYEELGIALGVTTAAAGQALVRARIALRRELRLEQVDVESLDPEVRAALGDISAHIDGELSGARRTAVDDLLERREAARRVKALFEEAGQRYRAWLPFPALLLGERAARAAEAQGLLGPRGSGQGQAGPGTAGVRRGTGARSPRTWGIAKVRVGRSAMVLGTIVFLLATAAVTARVGVPVDTSSNEPEVDQPASVEAREVEQPPTDAAPPAAPLVGAPAPVVSASQSMSDEEPTPTRPAPQRQARSEASSPVPAPEPAPAAETPPVGPPLTESPPVERPPVEPPPVAPLPERAPTEPTDPGTREPVDPKNPGKSPDPGTTPDPGVVPPTGPGGITIIPGPSTNVGGGGSGGLVSP